MRYIRGLERKDIGLDTSMIPLGSCTMKLNAAAEMLPVSWPEFARIHPFVPSDQAAGYHAAVRASSRRRSAEITGLAGRVAAAELRRAGRVRRPAGDPACHRDRGEGHAQRRADPAVRARHQPGERGDGRHAGRRRRLRAERQRRRRRSASARRGSTPIGWRADGHVSRRRTACSRTPSRTSAHIVHEHGGQVYMDGANMNAQVGLTSPAPIGADVCHLNLHKTFAIPHGGGGPGMGPIGVAAHLAPYLPGHPLVKTGGAKAIHAVSAAPWGSASILLISYGYIAMLGARRADATPPRSRSSTPTTSRRASSRTTRCSTRGTTAASRTR